MHFRIVILSMLYSCGYVVFMPVSVSAMTICKLEGYVWGKMAKYLLFKAGIYKITIE